MSRQDPALRPSPDEVQSHLHKILSSAHFAGSPRLSRFLRFVVEAALAGNADSLNEYAIGIDVYDRGEKFDAKADSIVRVEARRLRKALAKYYENEGARDRLVITVPKRAYAPAFERRSRLSSDSRRWGAAAAAVLILAGLIWLGSSIGRNDVAGEPPTPSIAVLPFQNLSGDPDSEYLAEGVTEALTADLGIVSGLRVMSRTTMQGYRKTTLTMPSIARELNVEYLVEGSVLWAAGDNLRISVQLIRAKQDEHVWSRNYVKPMTSILVLQREAARNIVEQVGVSLNDREESALGAAPAVETRAYEAYLKGRWAWGQWTAQTPSSAIKYLEESVRLDPEFAPSYAWLANSYRQSVKFGTGDIENLRKADLLADRALELDPELPEAHYSVGIGLAHKFQWAAAGERFRTAVELNPSDAEAHHVLAVFYLAPMGQLDEAIQELRFAMEREPTGMHHRGVLGLFLYCDGQFDEALSELNELLRLTPNHAFGLQARGLAHLAKGDHKRSIADLERAFSLSRQSRYAGYLAYAHARSGNREEAERRMEALSGVPGSEGARSYALGTAMLGLGKADEALEALLQAAKKRESAMVYFKLLPIFNELRGDPRHRQILEAVKLVKP